MPEEKHHERKREQELIGDLRRQTGRVIGRRFPNETSPDFPDETHQFHASESLLCHTQISIKLPPLSSPFLA
jgi:hypothetical protein